MERMILIERDDDLAICVSDYFQDRFLVSRLADLSAADRLLDREKAALLMADVSSRTSKESQLLEKIRAGHEEMHIVLTYLAPPAKLSWEDSLRHCADLLIRKPYSVMDVDSALRDLADPKSDRRYGNNEGGLN